MTVLELAIKTYGEDLQKQVAIEEMAELTKEICKDFRGKGDREHIIEEMADVAIMFEQLRIMYNISESELATVTSNKLIRLEERLREE